MKINDIQLEHVAPSGNRADVTIPELQPGEFCGIQVTWDRTPSPEDLREFNEEVWPKRIVPLAIRRAEQRTGKPQRAVGLQSGLSVLLPDLSVE